MTSNIGTTDRVIRIMAAIVLVSLAYAKVVTGAAVWIFLIIAAIFMLTSIASICPLYKIFHITTERK